MSYTAIKELLETRLNAVVGSAAPIAFENVAYRPIVGNAYLEAFMLPARTENPTFGAKHDRCPGIMQVNICVPQKIGAQAATTLADMLSSGFARGIVIERSPVRIVIDMAPFLGPALQDQAWYKVPLSIPYTADVF